MFKLVPVWLLAAAIVTAANSLAGPIYSGQEARAAVKATPEGEIRLGAPALVSSMTSSMSGSVGGAGGSPVRFQSGQRARGGTTGERDEGGTRGGGGNAVTAPGLRNPDMPPVSAEEADRALKAKSFAGNLNQGVLAATQAGTSQRQTLSGVRIAGDANAAAPASITELARALRNHPDLIYQYLRNNIEYYPTYGVQKGALGTILDNQGTAHDQAMLMVELLRASGYSASYVRGAINITAAQMKEWWGVDTASVCDVLTLLGRAQIPVYGIRAGSAGSCPGLASAMTDVTIAHIWVKVNLGGTNYVFDPSYKPHTLKSGINLDTASGYQASTFQSGALNGATRTADYVQNVNRTSINDYLKSYATNLSAHLRSNMPAATLDDVIGAKVITPLYGTLRQTALPYQDTSVATEEFAELPNYFKNTLRVQYQGIDQTFTSDAIYGRRLTISYNAANQPVLKLDGTAIGSPGTAAATGSLTTVSFTVTHNAYTDPTANHSFTQRIKAGGTSVYLIANGWGPAGRGVASAHQKTLAELRAAGEPATSERVLGSTLATLAAHWIAQVTHLGYMVERLSSTVMLYPHSVGIAGYNGSAYVDLPSNYGMPTSLAGDVAKERAAFAAWAMHTSILESTAVQQATGVSAVSTIKLLDLANSAGQRIYSATSANYASAVQPNLVGCAAHLANFSAYLAQGQRLILPARCDIAEGGWKGVGYLTLGNTAQGNTMLGSIISDGLSGGFATTPQAAQQTSDAVAASQPASNTLIAYNPNAGVSADPIDMAQGNFLYDHEDLSVGVGAFPQSLALRRLYSSGLRHQKGAFGRGWTHNLAASASVNSDGFQALGEDSALDAVGALVELKASLDLLTDPARPIEKLVIAAIAQRWFGEQLTNNTVIVTQGVTGEVFVKLPDGSYNPPPGKPVKLTRGADGSYSYETLHRAVLKFNAAGRAETYTEPSGLQLKYLYSGNNLASVQNNLGRTLNFTTNAAGLISQVSDGRFAYDRQREREEELIEVGRMYRAAIGAYYESTPSGRKAYPNQLEDLLRDPRHAITRRYMRRLPVDPLTARDFVPLVSPQGGIWGVASSSAARPLREVQPPDLLIPSLRHGGYRDWMFVYVPPP
jgi:hypothetical protein